MPAYSWATGELFPVESAKDEDRRIAVVLSDSLRNLS